MPFDPVAARKTANVLQAHRNHPGGELMLKASEQLLEAVNDAGNAMGQIRSAEASVVETKKKYDDALLEIKALREKMLLLDSALDVIRTVATTKKGASKVALDWLAANNLATETTPIEEGPDA